MLRNPISASRRAYSSPGSDPLNSVEQGRQAGLTDLPKARQPLLLRYWLRRSNSTPDEISGGPHKIDLTGKQPNPLPSQEPLNALATGCDSILPRFTFSRSRSRAESTEDPLANYQSGYAQFNNEHYQSYPDGWPRVAAFLDGCDSFGIYRRFSKCHSRLLVAHMTDITDIEKQLFEMDKNDEDGSTSWRLKNRYHEEGFDTTKRELLQKLETKLIAYDALLLNQRKLKALDKTPAKDHNSVFQWIWANKPLDDHEFDWIFHPGDFVSMVPPRQNRFEDFIRNHLDAQPKSYFKKFFKTRPDGSQDSSKEGEMEEVDIFSTARIITFARFIVVLFAVLVLLIPVLLFLMTSMSRACMAIVVLLFVFIFSIIMSLLTDAAIPEIFIGTSTYCAVLVTFLGNLQNART